MRTKALLRIVPVIVLLGTVAVQGQIGDPVFVGHGTDAKWSPDGRAISFLCNDSLLVVNVRQLAKPIFLHSGPIFKYEWVNDSLFATQERTSTPINGEELLVERIIAVTLGGITEEIAKDSVNLLAGDGRRLDLQRFANGSVGYFEMLAGKKVSVQLTNREKGITRETDCISPYVRTDQLIWGRVFLYCNEDATGKAITPLGERFSLPQLAPSVDKIVCWAPSGHAFVFDTSGVELSDLGGIDLAWWDPKGEFLIYCNSTYGHYDIEKADIFEIRYDGHEKRQLTSTPNVIEFDPSFSPDSNFILYRDYNSDALYVLRVR